MNLLTAEICLLHVLAGRRFRKLHGSNWTRAMSVIYLHLHDTAVQRATWNWMLSTVEQQK